MLLGDLFDLSLVGRAERPALDVDVAGGGVRTFTFGEINQRAARMATALRRRGIAPGDRVAVRLTNRVEFIDLFLACVRLGAVIVPINVLYREREIAHIVADADPAAIVTDAESLDLFAVGSSPSGPRPSALGPRSSVVDVRVLAQEADAAPASTVRPDLDGDAPAAIVYTSGTTGRSKGAVLSHNNFLANTTSIVSCWRISDRDRYLAVLPLFHVHGLGNGVCSWLAAGCRMRLVERFDHRRAADLFETFEPTLFFGVPTIYVRLLDLPLEAAQRIGRTARLFVSGSAPLPAHVFDAFHARFGHKILERYGMSETLMIMSNPYEGERRPGTVGRPLPGVSVRVITASGTVAGPGDVGGVQVRGSNVFRSYWRNDAATAAAFDEGWFRTGDVATLSGDGYYTLCGRESDLIISGGFNIYPREIEELLVELPAVSEAAVVGAPDARRGEVPVAYVVAREGFDPVAAEAACAKALASFKVPRAFVCIDALPRNALGKVQKHLLPPHRLEGRSE
jgi:malonyl-CoA/methylmalonyl-CoA synthetase